MALRSKGFYFSLDALLALMILSAVIGVVFKTYSIEGMGPTTDKGGNLMVNGLKQPVGDLNNSLNYSSPDKSVVSAIRSSYVEGRPDTSRMIAKNYLEGINHESAIYLTNKTASTLIYNTSSLNSVPEIRTHMVYLPYRPDSSKTLYNSAKLVVWN